MLSQWLYCIMLRMQQCSVHIIYKPGPDLYNTSWLSHCNHTENRGHEIAGMRVSMHTISTSVNMPACTSLEEIEVVTYDDTHLE